MGGSFCSQLAQVGRTTKGFAELVATGSRPDLGIEWMTRAGLVQRLQVWREASRQIPNA
jgi:hypothetical protein